MVSNGLTPKVMVCVTGISSGIDCERTQGFVFSFSFASPHGAGCVSKSVEIVLVTRFEQITYLWLENFLLGWRWWLIRMIAIELAFLFSSYGPSRISNIQKDKVIWLKSYIKCVAKFPSLDQRILIISDSRLSSLGFIKPCIRGLVPKLHPGKTAKMRFRSTELTANICCKPDQHSSFNVLLASLEPQFSYILCH